MRSIFILSFFLLISCGQNSSKKNELAKAISPVETNEPETPNLDDSQDAVNCKSQMHAEVIIDDLNWYEFSDAKTYDEYLNSKTVGILSIPTQNARCTAFIINSNTIMTNNHCVGNASEALNVTFKIRDTNQALKSFSCANFIMTSTTMDFTLLGCKENIGDIYGYNTLSDEEITVGDSMYVIQENCDYISNPYCVVNKMIAWGELEQVGTYVIGHNADTLGGSSGSPIYSGKTNQVIAIHNAGRSSSGSVSARNFGIPMTKVVSEIQGKVPSLKIYTKRDQTDSNSGCE